MSLDFSAEEFSEYLLHIALLVLSEWVWHPLWAGLSFKAGISDQQSTTLRLAAQLVFIRLLSPQVAWNTED